MAERLYKVLQSVTGHAVGDMAPASKFQNIEKLLRKRAITPTDEYGSDQPISTLEGADLAVEYDRSQSLIETLNGVIAARDKQIEALVTELESLRSRKKPGPKPGTKRAERTDPDEPSIDLELVDQSTNAEPIPSPDETQNDIGMPTDTTTDTTGE